MNSGGANSERIYSVYLRIINTHCEDAYARYSPQALNPSSVLTAMKLSHHSVSLDHVYRRSAMGRRWQESTTRGRSAKRPSYDEGVFNSLRSTTKVPGLRVVLNRP
mmetsp:Transcript_32460/g.65778  ORF Transcript_32460/g.65778 Transcript_32460/m.65778 type:complete len:106 (+) Transcript_32460:688-1005(+)